METKLTLEQLIPGDVLVMVGDLRPTNSTRALTELIMLLTDSDVSHSALFVGKSANGHYQLVDAVLSSVGYRDIADNNNSDDPQYGRWYVRRMQKPSLAPVVKSAEYYIGNAVYDKAWLVMLGILLVVDNILPEGPKERLTMAVLKHLFYAIDQHLHHNGMSDFVCSEYVAVAFKDAGPSYELQYKSGALMAKANPMAVLRRRFPSVQPLAMESDVLLQALGELNRLDPQLQLKAEGTGTVDERFLNDTAKLVVMLLKTTDLSTRARVLTKAASYQSAFVTPACLKDGCENLTDEGEITLGYGQ
ncbi:hypothetical protein [Gallaecimonas mangrovi]|uniref:hypothetical protein n=1 Tax=Gallaecimonas mangrovi TaxID=2291597 RepID=UPI000E206595|nr:hypothetical protein [Gallaecimonas mangrovi]